MALTGKVLVTPRSVTRDGHPALDRVAAAGHQVVLGPRGRQPAEEELLALLPGCVGYLAGVEPVTQRVLEAAHGLRVISRNGTGIDNIDLAAAAAKRIAVARAEGANARGVAELTIGLLFALARGIAFCDARLKAGAWERRNGIELEGRTLGLIGCGRIGRRVAEMALRVGLRVVAQDAYPDSRFAPGGPFRFASVEAVLTEADFLSLHCPPAPGGGAILDSAALGRMKRGAFVVNTARYSLIDPEALLGALDSGQIAGAALDVFDAEPPDDWRLAKHPRVVALPHAGGLTEESIGRAMDVAVDNLLRELAGAS